MSLHDPLTADRFEASSARLADPHPSLRRPVRLADIVLAGALALTGCAGGQSTQESSEESSPAESPESSAESSAPSSSSSDATASTDVPSGPASSESAAALEPAPTATSAEILDPVPVPATELQVGDCLVDPTMFLAGNDPQHNTEHDQEMENAGTEIQVVDCGGAHDAEIFHQFEVPGDTYPGTNEQDWAPLVDEECLGVAGAALGEPERGMSAWRIGYFGLTEQAWNSGARVVSCKVSHAEAAWWTGAVPSQQVHLGFDDAKAPPAVHGYDAAGNYLDPDDAAATP